MMKANKELTPLQSAIECLQDVISHHNDFRSACGTRHHADLEKYGGDSASYWDKQQCVLDRMKAQAESALPAVRAALASQAAPQSIAGLGRMTNEDDGFITLQFVDESAAQRFMQDYKPTVEVDDMPDLQPEPAPAVAADAIGGGNA